MTAGDLQSDNRLLRLERFEFFLFDHLGVLIHDRVEHPTAVDAHAAGEIIEVVHDLRLQADASVPAVISAG